MTSGSKSVLVVGAAGYIGSNCDIPGFDGCDKTRHSDFLELKVKQYDVIVFLACDLRNTEMAFAYNEFLYRRLDKWLKAFPETHVIYTSSAAVYGEGSGYEPNCEKDLPMPINLYGYSKLAGEYRIREYLNHTILRLGNVYGFMSALHGRGVTELFQGGNKIIYGDGNQVRDFVRVETVWEVINSAIKHSDIWRGVFNVSDNDFHTINEWFEKHGSGQPEYGARREGDIEVSILDNRKMNKALALCQ